MLYFLRILTGKSQGFCRRTVSAPSNSLPPSQTAEFLRGQGHKGAALLRPDDGSSKLMADSHDELRRAAKVADVDAAAFGTA